MEWTDERMDDLATHLRDGFTTVHADLRDIRAEGRAARSELKAEIDNTRSELNAAIGALRTDMNRWGIAIMLALIGLAGANLVPGVGG